MEDRPDRSKRRFIKSGLVSVPVVITLTARPAWAQQPGPSGYTPYQPEGQPGGAPGQAPGAGQPGGVSGQPPFGSGVRHVSPTGRGEDLG
jgi:hypothetical protein